jgi:hypothetical protein
MSLLTDVESACASLSVILFLKADEEEAKSETYTTAQRVLLNLRAAIEKEEERLSKHES